MRRKQFREAGSELRDDLTFARVRVAMCESVERRILRLHFDDGRSKCLV